MSGKKYSISWSFEFEWFEWIMFWDKTVPYPNDHFKLGRFLGLVLPWWKKILRSMVRSFIGPSNKHWPKNNGNRKSARIDVTHSWHLYTRSWFLALSWETFLNWVWRTLHSTIHMRMNPIMPKCFPCLMKTRSNSRVKVPVGKCWNVALKKRQNG